MGDAFVFTLKGDFYKNQVWSFADAVSFPCFRDETLMIQLTEFDDALDDQTQVFVDCASL